MIQYFRPLLRRQMLLILFVLTGFSISSLAYSVETKGEADCLTLPTVDWSDYDATVENLRTLYRSDQFASLEPA